MNRRPESTDTIMQKYNRTPLEEVWRMLSELRACRTSPDPEQRQVWAGVVRTIAFAHGQVAQLKARKTEPAS